jgi:hypothetical protein
MPRSFRHTAVARRCFATYLACLVLVLSCFTAVAGEHDPGKPSATLSVAPVHLETSSTGLLKTDHGTGTPSLAVLDAWLHPDKHRSSWSYCPARAGTAYRLTSFFLYTETASSRL